MGILWTVESILNSALQGIVCKMTPRFWPVGSGLLGISWRLKTSTDDRIHPGKESHEISGRTEWAVSPEKVLLCKD